jgi:hypothetical protein
MDDPSEQGRGTNGFPRETEGQISSGSVQTDAVGQSWGNRPHREPSRTMDSAEPVAAPPERGDTHAPNAGDSGAVDDELRELQEELTRAVLDGRGALARAIAERIDRLKTARAAGVVQLDVERGRRRR